MFVPPDVNAEAGNLVDAAQVFLTTQDMEPVAFVLVVDRSGQWRSVHAPDGQQVPLDEEEGKFAEATATWWVRETGSRCVRIGVGPLLQHVHYP